MGCTRPLVAHLPQVRVCTRLGVQLLSTDFKSQDYYSNIRKAITAGYFMQVASLTLFVPTTKNCGSLGYIVLQSGVLNW